MGRSRQRGGRLGGGGLGGVGVSGWKLVLACSAVVAALVVAGGLQYRWAILSAVVEGDQQRLRILSSVTQAVVLEYRKLVPPNLEKLVDSGVDVGPSSDSAVANYYATSAEEDRPVVERVAFLRRSDAGLFELTGGGWVPLRDANGEFSSILAYWDDSRGSESRTHGYIEVTSPGSAWFLITFSREPDRALLLTINHRLFIDSRLIPSLGELLPGYNCYYSFGGDATSTGEESSLKPLLLKEHGSPPASFSLVNLLSSLRGGRDIHHLPLSGGEIQLSGGLRRGLRPIRRENFSRDSEGKAADPEKGRVPAVLVLESDGNSPITSAERRIALNWLVGQLLLLLAGGAFLLLLIHWHKLQLQRVREREFVASVTHELRTPLTVLSSAADNLREGVVASGRIREYGDTMFTQTLRLSRMIEELLSLAKLEDGTGSKTLPIEISPGMVEQRLMERLTPAQLDEWLDRIQIDFGSLPGNLTVDFDRLDLILGNLFINGIIHGTFPPSDSASLPATEASRSGHGTLRISGTLKGKRLLFVVEDDGGGVPVREQRRIFAPFFRGSRSRNAQTPGAGLGLHLARRSAELLGGSLTLESPYQAEDGSFCRGCRFILDIPHTECRIGSGGDA